MTETLSGRETVQIVEIEQPFCANTFGVAPCTAIGTDDEKCYNTFASCRDRTNFALGDPLKLYYSRGHLSERDVPDVPYIMPLLVSVSTAPTRINMSGSDPNAGGLGNRANCQIVLKDVPHTDRVVDPYLSGRSWNPMSADRGSYWTRWLARNKYRQNVVMRVYEGYKGQTLAEMKSRTFFLQEVEPPSSGEGATITMTGMDILAKLEERKAQVPQASPGKLTLAISAVATSFEVSNAVTTDYPAPGTVRIGTEIMTYTGVAASANGVTLSGVVRGTDRSTAATHEQDATVQICWRLTNATVEDALEELLGTWGGIATAWLDLAQWSDELGTFLVSYQLKGLVTEPTSVAQVVSEINEQALCNQWWDERVSKVRTKSIRGIDEEPPLLTDAEHIKEGTFQLMEMPRERASQVWIYYKPQSFTGNVTDPKTYEQVFIDTRLESEGEVQYGEPSIKKIFARFLDVEALASNTAAKYINRHVDVPNACTFQMDAKDRSKWLGQDIRISHFRDVDVYGARLIRTWTIISAEEVVPGEVIEVECRDTTPYGKVSFIMAGGTADYPGAALAPFKSAYIGNADGLLSDGLPCARIS